MTIPLETIYTNITTCNTEKPQQKCSFGMVGKRYLFLFIFIFFFTGGGGGGGGAEVGGALKFILYIVFLPFFS